jgi:putative ABC transport system permease protein
VTELAGDVSYALRGLLKNPAFSVVSLLTLAVGIGANTAIFSFVDGALLKPLPYEHPERIVRVLEKPPGGDYNGISTLNYLDWQKENTVFEYMAAQTGGPVTLTGSGAPVQIRGGRVSAKFFDIFRAPVALGRAFAPGEDESGKNFVAVLSNQLWRTQFGADPGIVGRKVLLDGQPHLIIGVLSEGSAFDRAFNQIWRPLAFEPENMPRNFHWFGAYARLKPGVTLEQAHSQMNAIGSRIAHDYPDSNKGWGVAVDRFSDVLIGKPMRQSLYVLLASVGMILLIACANLANLTLARSVERAREVAIRAALGAGRSRLIRQFLTESVLLSCCGGILGIGIGYATMAGLRAAIPLYTFPREVSITMDGRVLLFTLAISVLTGIVFGLAPAIHASRASLTASMRESGRGSGTGRTQQRLRGALVVTEVALAFVLLTSAGLLIRSFFQIQQVETGFDATNVITAVLPIPEKRYSDAIELNNYLRQIVDRVEAVPGVRDVALTSALPMRGWGYGMPFQIAGRAFVDRAHRPSCFFKMVSPSYFRALGMRLRKGRGLTDRDLAGAPPVTVINETMAKKYFANQEPLGQRILVQQIVPGKTQLGPEIPWEVVGVVADETVGNLDDTVAASGMYVTNEQSPAFFQALVVRAGTNPALLGEALRKSVYAVNKDQPLTDVKLLEQIKSESMATDRLRAVLIGVFAAVAMALSAIGIYGVISYSVVQRTQEIGIRAALGASSAATRWLILRSGLRMTATGLLIGCGGALALTRLLAVLLFGVGARDPVTKMIVAGILAVMALLACYLPAHRATNVDPLVALRYE